MRQITLQYVSQDPVAGGKVERVLVVGDNAKFNSRALSDELNLFLKELDIKGLVEMDPRDSEVLAAMTKAKESSEAGGAGGVGTAVH